jgi:hypothetical protein
MSGRDSIPPPQDPAEYPPYVTRAEERRRWDLSVAIARSLMYDPLGTDPAAVWTMTRQIYHSEIPT